MQDQYSQKVSSPHRVKQTQRIQKEINDYQEARNRYDKEKEFIERQKQQARDLNNQQLKMQLEERNHLKQLNDTSLFNKNQAQLQAEQNKQMDEYLQSNKKQMQKRYKDMLD